MFPSTDFNEKLCCVGLDSQILFFRETLFRLRMLPRPPFSSMKFFVVCSVGYLLLSVGCAFFFFLGVVVLLWFCRFVGCVALSDWGLFEVPFGLLLLVSLLRALSVKFVLQCVHIL